MVSVLTLIAVDCGFSPDRIKPKTIKIIFFASPHVALRRKSKDWLVLNQDNESVDCCFSGLVESESHHHLIEN
jgi:hypothetical protein